MNVSYINFALKMGCLLKVDGNDVKPVWYLERLWRVIKCAIYGRERAFADCKSVDVATKLGEIYERTSQNLSMQRREKFFNIAKTLMGRVKKKANKDALDVIVNGIFNKHIIEYKKKLVQGSLDLMLDYRESNENVKEAYDFLRTVMAKLEQGKNAPLPLWFHATSTEKNVDGIYGGGEVKQHNAARGYGSFVSSNWETMYGDFVFALDFSSDLSSFPGHWFNSLQAAIRDPYKKVARYVTSVWVRVENNIPINDDTLSFVIIRSPDLLTDQRYTEISNKYNPTCLTVGQYEAIRTAFLTVIENDASMKRSLPPRWQQMNRYERPLPVEFK